MASATTTATIILVGFAVISIFDITTASVVELIASKEAGGSVFGTEDIPGRNRSLHYEASVRVDESQPWSKLFVIESMAKNASIPDNAGYFSHLNFWTSSWVSLETSTKAEGLNTFQPMQLLVQRTNTSTKLEVKTATIHPKSSMASVVSVDNNGAIINIPGPCQFVIDFDVGLDTTDTGPSYVGPPMHTFSVFINPPLFKPDTFDPSVHVVHAGDSIPSNLSAGSTVLFGPGVHLSPRNQTTGWRIYTLIENVRYFVPMDAIWHSSLNTGSWGAANITFEGYGCLSGEDMSRISWTNGTKTLNNSPQGLTIAGAHTALVQGMTLIDFPNHHIITQTTDCKRSVMNNVKVMGWRANGDGVHVFGGWSISNLFLRTQDDSLYLSTGSFPKAGCEATTFSKIITWNDANGASFIVSGFGTSLTDSDVVYARASWSWWSGGRVFSHRTDFNGSVEDVNIIDVRVEDPLPSFNAFQIAETTPISGATYKNVLFKNINIQAVSTQRQCPGNGCNCVPVCEPGSLPFGIPNVIAVATTSDNRVNITNLRFENCSISGVNIKHMLPLHGAGSELLPGYFNVSTRGVFNLTAI